MAQPPGSDFGSDFFKFVLGPVNDTLTSFAKVALPTPSGLPSPLQLGIPGLTTPGPFYGGGSAIAGAGPEYNSGLATGPRSGGGALADAGTTDPLMAKLWGQTPEQKKAAEKKAAETAVRPTGEGAAAYSGTYAPNVQRFASIINQVANETGVPARVLASIVHIECANCDPNTVRKDTGAAGISQVKGASVDPYQNLTAAANLLREKQKAFGIGPDDWPSTAAAYFGAWQPGVGVTNARDATGMTGYGYVDLFKNAYNLYPETLGQTPRSVSAVGYADSRPTQFDKWLSFDEQNAACGPAVVAGLSGMSVREATDKAAAAGLWSANTGMGGGGAESTLLTSAGVPNRYVPHVNVQEARDHVDSGHPVIFSMSYVSRDQPGHYFLADMFDPRNGKWHVGTSGTDIKSAKGGGEWMTLEQMAQMGPPESMILVDK